MAGALDTTAAIGHEILFAGVDLLHYIPIHGLEIAAQNLLRIWDELRLLKWVLIEPSPGPMTLALTYTSVGESSRISTVD